MTEEIKQEEQKPSFLEEVKAERMALEKVRDENKVLINRMEQLKAEQMLGGTADAGQKQPEKKEETPKEYAERMSKGG